MTIITFDHLINEEFYNNIKKRFLEDDEKYKPLKLKGDDFDVDLNDNSITFFRDKVTSTKKVKHKGYEKDSDQIIEFEDEFYETVREEVTLNFTDYINTEIKGFAKMYTDSFKRKRKSDKIYNDNAIENYCKEELNYLTNMIDNVNIASHLNQTIKKETITSIDDIYAIISNDIYQKHFEIPTKIPFNLKSNQVVGLFYLLYENENISSDIKLNDMLRIIEQTFLFYDSKSNTYESIKDANKVRRSLFGANPDKSAKKALEGLKNILCDDDFYSI